MTDLVAFLVAALERLFVPSVTGVLCRKGGRA